MKHPATFPILFTLSCLWLTAACARGGEEPTDPRTEAAPREAVAPGTPDPGLVPQGPDSTTIRTDDPEAFSSAQPGGDRDGDGVPDTNDQCPDNPEDRDAFQDSDGCPEPDNDADGIPDIDDKCPNEPEDLDGFEDDDGCPDR